MPDSILFNDFSQGWCPSDDAIKGRKNALMQMDNLELDRNGAVTLANGSFVMRTYAANAHTLYSSMVGTVRHDYAALTDGAVVRDGVNIGTGGNTSRAAFGAAFKYTLSCSGDVRLKDDGSATAVNLGVKAPTAAMTLYGDVVPTVNDVLPLFTYNIIPSVDGTTPGVPVNVFSSVLLQCTYNATTGIYICQSYNVPSIPFDWNSSWTPAATGTQDDYIYMNGTNLWPDTDTLTLDICLQTPGSLGAKVDNYFSATPATSSFSYNSNGWKVKIKRSDFTKVGPVNFGWDSVRGFRITLTTTALGHVDTYMQAGAVSTVGFTGGSITQNGLYEYAQMNVNNTGQSLAKSLLGPKSALITETMTSAIMNIQNPTAIDSQVNEVWVFRRSVDGLGLLDQWYRVAVIVAANFGNRLYDYTSDTDALTLDITVNNNLLPLLSTLITDPILDIIGPINGRWYYFTNNYMYPSEINNPDSVDISLGIKITSSINEIFMWARSISEGIILVATSLNIHTLTGTFTTLPDNSVDIYFRNLSVKYLPISIDVAVFSGTAFYMATDGWRSIDAQGVNKSLVAPNTDRLYRHITAQGYTGADVKVAPGQYRFPVCIANNKLWCFVTNTGRAEVWDFHRQYWRVLNYAQTNAYYGTSFGTVTASISTPNGLVFASGTDSKLRMIDWQDSKIIDVAYKQGFLLQTPVLDGGYPKQRKDLYTIKFRISNLGQVTCKLKDDLGIEYTIYIPANSTIKEYSVNLKDYVDKAKTLQVQLYGLVDDLVLEDIEILYDILPPQQSYLRVRPENYGTTGLKRLFAVPFVVDTLGNNVTITPTIDDVPQASLTVTSSRKKSFTYEFPTLGTTDIIKGVDYQFDVSCSSGLFEWYGFLPPKHIELLPEPLISYVIPTTDFGTAAKKRMRVWPFVINTHGQNVSFIPIVDGAANYSNISTFNTNDYLTVRHQFLTDVFGVDFSGIFTASNSSIPFEFREILQPDFVQILPIARKFDQLGPEELFREGKVVTMEIRVLPYSGSLGGYSNLPFNIYMNDVSIETGNISVANGVEATYFRSIQKSTFGNVIRMELGPTPYDFHRFYARFKVIYSGADTDQTWLTLPAQG